MSFTPDDVKKIAHLSYLDISDEQVPEIAKKFNSVMELVKKMESNNTDAIEPLAHPFDEIQPTRPDEVTETNQRQALQAIAPDIKAGLYIVPQFIETE